MYSRSSLSIFKLKNTFIKTPLTQAQICKMSDYKPTEHDGLKQDGTPDKRVGTGEFAHGKVDPHEAGHQGGKSSGSGGSSGASGDSSGGDYKPTENDGLKKDGTPDQRVKGN